MEAESLTGQAPQQRQKMPQSEYQKLVRQVAERVWQLWREELRKEREQRSAAGGQH